MNKRRALTAMAALAALAVACFGSMSQAQTTGPKVWGNEYAPTPVVLDFLQILKEELNREIARKKGQDGFFVAPGRSGVINIESVLEDPEDGDVFDGPVPDEVLAAATSGGGTGLIAGWPMTAAAD